MEKPLVIWLVLIAAPLLFGALCALVLCKPWAQGLSVLVPWVTFLILIYAQSIAGLTEK